MADEATNQAGEKKEKKPKTVVMVMAMLVIEAVVIVGAMMFLGGKPADVAAAHDPHAAAAVAEEDKIVETLVLEARMPNNKSGVTYLFATEIYVQTKQKHAEEVAAEIEQFQAEIKADVTAIWRMSEPQHFQEPKLETLTRKVYALLNDRFGNADGSEDPIVLKVVIVMSTGYRLES
jgi:flagellar basal body-associated protein FliL